MEEKYDVLVKRAEKAVAGVKDPELRRVAFDKILGHLLAASSSESAQMPKAATPDKVSAPSRAKPRKKNMGPKDLVKELADEGFFNEPKTISEVKAELVDRGRHIPVTSLSGPLQKLCWERVLRRQRITKGKKVNFAYSKW